MFKNSTPRQIAIFIAAFTTLAILLLGLLGWLFLAGTGAGWLVLFAIPLVFGLSYGITIYYLKKYIYRKIKLIYKTIHKAKRSPQDKTLLMDVDTNIMDEVEREVTNWANQQDAEIAKYKSWAEYRRRFVGDISHELKTPLFNIQGYLHTLLDGGLDDKKISHDFLRKAVKNVDRLETILEDLSAISKLESGDLLLEMQVFDIKDLTEEVFEELEFKAAEKKIFLEFKEGANHNFRVRADRESIRQVLLNLILNSIKYGNQNGKTKVGFYDMDRYILVEVADNGIGIPQKHLAHVFDRFYRVDKSRSRAQGGSGLGLSIVKHIVEAHQQTINVRSTAELGSTFGFTLEKV
jgi:two-component system, OmpR family, phosphate regulon sensor histidine kinase PhoR